MSLDTFIGLAAAFCTTASYVPQVRKTWKTGKTGDLSLKMLMFLAAGLSLWIIYGLMKGDRIIIAANGVSLALLSCILYIKLRGTDNHHASSVEE